MTTGTEVFNRLAELGFTQSEIVTIGNWWELYTSDEHYGWFMTASAAEISEATDPAFTDTNY